MIGKLRERLTIQAPSLTDDGVGGKNRQWRTIGKVWANLREVSGQETEFAQGQQAIRKMRVTIRWRGDMNSHMRFVYGTRLLYIVAMLDERGTRRFLTCLCEEHV